MTCRFRVIEYPGSFVADLAERGDRQTVREVQVVHRRERLRAVHDPGRVRTRSVAEVRAAPGLVQGRPDGDAVAEPLADDARVVGERLGRVPVRPAALVFEGLRQVPVVQRRDGPDAAVDESVDEALVEREPRLVGGAAPGRLDARPRDREAVGLEAEVGHEVEVGLPAVVVVVGDVAGVPVPAPCPGCG